MRFPRPSRKTLEFLVLVLIMGAIVVFVKLHGEN
jgi:hypothetical protein